MAENNSSLVKAMKTMKANNDEVSKNAFVKELMFSKFLVPVNISPEPINNEVKAGSVISYMTIKNNNDGKNFLIVFSCNAEYNKFFGERKATHLINHTYSDIKTLVLQKKFNGFIIDPAGENVSITAELMKKIAEVAAPLQVKSEKVVVDGNGNSLTPATLVAQDFKDTLVEYLKTQDNINKCYLMQTVRENETKPTLVVVADFDGGDMQKTFNGIASAVRKHLKVNDTIGLMPVTDSVAAAAVLSATPIYEK